MCGIVGLIVGIFLGAWIGFFTASLCVAAGRKNDQVELKDGDQG